MGCHLGISLVVNATRSVTRRTEGSGGNTYSFCAWYSFKMSFWSVPPRRWRGVPCSSATTRYMAMMTAAGELMVIEVVTALRSMPANKVAMSSTVSMATPALPTSPRAKGSSESRPSSVGMSKAVDSPVPPLARSWWNRAVVSLADPKPAN